jgi:hypothetical protein
MNIILKFQHFVITDNCSEKLFLQIVILNNSICKAALDKFEIIVKIHQKKK